MDDLILQRFIEELSILLSPIMDSKQAYKDSTNTFSFFEIVSDYYYRETFHSDILYALLNPDTPGIGEITSNTFLRRFLELINVPYDSGAEYVVKKEDSANTTESNGRMDLSIVGNGFSIIIENKINNAVEQKNQLARYVESLRQRNRNNKICIVYLTLTPEKAQEPSISCYSDQYQEIIYEIETGIIPLFLWAGSNTTNETRWLKKSLIDLLDDCISDILQDENRDSASCTTLVFCNI